ncbi:MAG: transposase, partial [Akkermansia sp.]
RYAHARQMKRAAKQVKKLKHRSAIEPVIGHLKSDCRLERNYLTGEEGNAINAILSAAGYNFRKLLKELVKLFVLIRIMLQGRMIAQLPSI